MKNLRKVLTIVVLISLSILYVNAADHPTDVKKETAKILCGCGEIKGTANCCNPEAARCDKCSKIKGSIGCCKKIEAGAKICTSCGEVKGSKKCCNKEAKKCGKCGLIKGSPGCCKL